MVFSPDRTLMASTHGDHNIYVTETKVAFFVNKSWTKFFFIHVTINTVFK